MIFTITDLVNAEKFTHIFQQLKNFTDNINIDFLPDKVYIQGMDTAHVSLYEISLDASFFEKYLPAYKNIFGAIYSSKRYSSGKRFVNVFLISLIFLVS